MGVFINRESTIFELLMMNTQLLCTKSKLEKIINRFQEYLKNDDNNSEAISSHKTYIQTAQLPVTKGMIEICDRKVEANGKYIERLHSLFSEDNDIDQDYWTEMYNKLCEQYNEINNLKTMAVQFLKSLVVPFYEPETAYGEQYMSGQADTSPTIEDNTDLSEYYRYIIDSYAKELEVLRTAIAYYSGKLLRVDNLLRDLHGLYYQANILNDSLTIAIQQLENIGVTRNGNYYYHNVDCSAFENLEATIESLDMAVSV